MTGIRQHLHHSLFLCNQVDTDICIHLSDQHRSLYLRYDKIKNTGILHTWISFHMEEGILIILTEGFLNGALKRAILRGYCCRFRSAPVEFWRYQKKFHQGALTYSNLLWWFCVRSIKTWKGGPIFSSFNPCSSLPFFATDERKQFQCPIIVSENKTRPLFLEFNRWENSFSFWKDSRLRDVAL